MQAMVSRVAHSQPRQQLALDVRLSDAATLDNFLPFGSHAAVIAALAEQLEPSGEPVLYLAGPQGAGKSHLLQAACHAAGKGAAYLPLSDLVEYPAGDDELAARVLEGYESLELVCLDDLQASVGLPAWERALFNLYNRCRDSGCRLVVAAVGAPRTLAFELPDLQSRLSWATVYQLPAADEARRLDILQFRAARQGMSLPLEVARFISIRASRNMADLMGILARLDAVSLAEQRKLSVPFVKHALGWA